MDTNLTKTLLNFSYGLVPLDFSTDILQHYLTTQISDTDPFYMVHILAKNERLNSVPVEFLTHKVLTFPASDGWTACHYAAANGSLKTIPGLNSKMLSVQDEDGRTPMHVLAYNCCPDIPPSIASQTVLGIRDSLGDTVLHTALTRVMNKKWQIGRCGTLDLLFTKIIAG